MHFDCTVRDIAPVIPLRPTPEVKRGERMHQSASMVSARFAGADRKRGATKWRCPTGECTPASMWIKANRLKPLIPRETPRRKALYRGRGSVERAFGKLKHEWGLGPLRVRGIERAYNFTRTSTILSQLTCALSRERGMALVARAA